MEIEIINFRSIEYRKFNIDTGFYLLSGNSGAGKSTLLESLEWVLYGGKVVSPFHLKSKKELTKVSLFLNNLKIIRTKPPDKLIVKKEETVLESDEAQNYINQIFGSKLFWKTTSYLSQDYRHNLLFGSKDDKNEIIKELIYGIDISKQNPDYYLEKVNEYSKTVASKIDFHLGKIDYLSELLEENVKPDISDEDKIFYSKLMDKKKEELECKKKEAEKNLILLQEKDKLIDSRKETLTKLKDYPELNLQKINKWKEYIKYSRELNQLPEFEINDTSSEILKKEIILIEEDYRIYKINHNKSNRLDVEYSENIIRKSIKKLEDQISKLEKYERYLEMKRNVDKITVQIKTTNEKIDNLKKIEKEGFEKIKRIGLILKIEPDLGLIKDRLNELKTDFLTCPSCNKKVILTRGKLVEESGHFLDKSIVEKIKIEYNRISENTKLLNKEIDNLEVLNSIYSEMEIPEKIDKVEGNKEKISQLVDKLKEIKVIEFDNQKYSKLKKDLYNSEMTEKEKQLKEKIEINYQVELDDINPPDNFSSYFNNYQSLKENLKLLDERLQKLESLDKVKISKNIEKLNDIFEKFEQITEIKQIEEKEKKLESMKSDLKKLIVTKENCSKIKKIIEDVSSKTFEGLIIHFNKLLNQILQEIFDNIQIEIGMFKKVKGKNILKPQFNMKVLLKGNEYDNLNFLSGGEKDRISIALLVTLSVLTNNKFIMFDESMSSLDEEMRNQTLNLIKKYLPDKTVLNICHFTVEGFYDHIINF